MLYYVNNQIFYSVLSKHVIAIVMLFFCFLLKVKGHIVISVTWYPKPLPIDLLKNFTVPVIVSVWQDWNVAENELFITSHGEVYTIRYALLCEACLCDIPGGRLAFLERAYIRENNGTFAARW